MASLKFLVLALFFTCLWLACSSAYVGRDYKQTEIMNPNDETDVKKPEQFGGGYGTGDGGGYQYGQCKFGCCYKGPRGCIRCCKSANEESYAVGMHKRGQVAKKAKEQEASPMWAQGQP